MLVEWVGEWPSLPGVVQLINLYNRCPQLATGLAGGHPSPEGSGDPPPTRGAGDITSGRLSWPPSPDPPPSPLLPLSAPLTTCPSSTPRLLCFFRLPRAANFILALTTVKLNTGKRWGVQYLSFLFHFYSIEDTVKSYKSLCISLSLSLGQSVICQYVIGQSVICQSVIGQSVIGQSVIGQSVTIYRWNIQKKVCSLRCCLVSFSSFCPCCGNHLPAEVSECPEDTMCFHHDDAICLPSSSSSTFLSILQNNWLLINLFVRSLHSNTF